MTAEMLFRFIPFLFCIYVFVKSTKIVFKYRKNIELTRYKGLKTLSLNPFSMQEYKGKTAWYLALLGAVISVLFGFLFSLIFLGNILTL